MIAAFSEVEPVALSSGMRKRTFLDGGEKVTHLVRLM